MLNELMLLIAMPALFILGPAVIALVFEAIDNKHRG